jgi:hypothetical protein
MNAAGVRVVSSCETGVAVWLSGPGFSWLMSTLSSWAGWKSVGAAAMRWLDFGCLSTDQGDLDQVVGEYSVPVPD